MRIYYILLYNYTKFSSLTEIILHVNNPERYLQYKKTRSAAHPFLYLLFRNKRELEPKDFIVITNWINDYLVKKHGLTW
jgi:hypothetical protein